MQRKQQNPKNPPKAVSSSGLGSARVTGAVTHQIGGKFWKEDSSSSGNPALMSDLLKVLTYTCSLQETTASVLPHPARP